MTRVTILSPSQEVTGRELRQLAKEYARLFTEAGADVTIRTESVVRRQPAKAGFGQDETFPALPFFAPERHLQRTLDAFTLASRATRDGEAVGFEDVVVCLDWATALVGALLQRTGRAVHVQIGAYASADLRSGPNPVHDWIAQMERWAAEQARVVVYPSQSVLEEAKAHQVPTSAVTVVLPTVVSVDSRLAVEDISEFRESLARPDEKILLVALDSAPPGAQDLIAELTPSLLYQRPTTKLVVVGRASNGMPAVPEKLEKAVKMGRALLLSDVGDTVHSALLQSADAVLCPGADEPLSTVVWEAAALGVPVVAPLSTASHEASTSGCKVHAATGKNAEAWLPNCINALDSGSWKDNTSHARPVGEREAKARAAVQTILSVARKPQGR